MITPEIKKELLELGLNVDQQIERFFDSEETFLKFFRKFFISSEDVMKELERAIAIGERGLIEAHAHALKSIAGNIGFDGVFEPAQKIVNDMRAGVNGEAESDLARIKWAYGTAQSICEKL